MKIIPKINLILNFKPENKTYRFVKDKQIDITDLASRYLQIKYPNSFIREVNMEESSIPMMKEDIVKEENVLNSLVQIEDRHEEEKANIKKIIEKAIEQGIIIKQGVYYKVETEVCKTLRKVKELLESDKEILNKIMARIQ